LLDDDGVHCPFVACATHDHNFVAGVVMIILRPFGLVLAISLMPAWFVALASSDYRRVANKPDGLARQRAQRASSMSAGLTHDHCSTVG